MKKPRATNQFIATLFLFFIAVSGGCFHANGGTQKSNDASLHSLALSEGSLYPAFDAATTAYTAKVLSSGSSPHITPVSLDEKATVTVNGAFVESGTDSAVINLSIGTNTITVSVTAEDGITLKTYTITITCSHGKDLTPQMVGPGALGISSFTDVAGGYCTGRAPFVPQEWITK